MKKKASKDLIALFILIPVFLIGAFFISDRFGGRFPDDSVLNKTVSGYSVFFDVLMELDFPVSRTLQPVNALESGCIQMVVQAGSFDIDDSGVEAWLKSGGILIYFTDGDYLPELFDTAPEINGPLKIYRVSPGTAVVADASRFTNKALVDGSNDAYVLAGFIAKSAPKKIYFNEAAMYTGEGRQTLWSYTPKEIKFILFQLLLALGVFLYQKGKRFGKPVPLYEEAERSENEYLFSVASLYSQAKCWDLVLANYYRSFLRELRYPHEGWLRHWEKEYPDSMKKALAVFEFMDKPLNKHSVKDYLQIVATLEHLKTIMRKRREIGWKTMKKAL